MAEPRVEPEPTVDPDETIRDELRAKLREMNAEKPDRRKHRWSLSKAEEAAIGPTLFTSPRNW